MASERLDLNDIEQVYEPAVVRNVLAALQQLAYTATRNKQGYKISECAVIYIDVNSSLWGDIALALRPDGAALWKQIQDCGALPGYARACGNAICDTLCDFVRDSFLDGQARADLIEALKKTPRKNWVKAIILFDFGIEVREVDPKSTRGHH